jgi:hypothetical protein
MKEGQRFQLTEAILQVLPLMKSILHISDKLELSGVAPYYVLESPPYSIVV